MKFNFFSMYLIGFTLLNLNQKGYAQNLYNFSSWTVGQGSTTEFPAFGSINYNIRELGLNHLGQEVVLWKCIPDPNSSADGGFEADYKPIDNTKTYRISIWMKKTNSLGSNNSFGPRSFGNGIHQTLRLDGSQDNNPFFWVGDLPKLNHWYLLIGYVHPFNYTGVSIGKIYDGATGEVVMNTQRDFKFSTNATNLRGRAFVWNNPNLDDRLYLYQLTMEAIDGTENTIEQLLGVNPESKLLFVFDNAGNQKQRYYCRDSQCSEPNAPLGRAFIKDDDLKEEEILAQKDLRIYPNPTKGQITVSIISDEDISFRDDIQIFNNNGVRVYTGGFKDKTSVTIDLSRLSNGTYLFHAHLSDGTTFNKQIIKN